MLARIHLKQKGGCRVRDPRFRDWFARLEDNDGGFAGLDDCLDEGAHGADEGKIIDIDVLACSGVEALLLREDQYGSYGALQTLTQSSFWSRDQVPTTTTATSAS